MNEQINGVALSLSLRVGLSLNSLTFILQTDPGSSSVYPPKFQVEQNLNANATIAAISRCQEINFSEGLRFLAAVLIFFSGILHFVVGLLSGSDVATMAVGVGFGVAYMIIGVGLFMGKRLFYYVGIILPLIGGIGGTLVYVTTQATTPLIAVMIDVIVILCCAYLLLHKEPHPAS